MHWSSVGWCFLLCSPILAEGLQWYVVPADADPPAQAEVSVQPVPVVAEKPVAALASSSRPYQGMIEDVARQYALDPLLIHAVVQAESAYRPSVVSNKGAVGLMQLLPATAARFGQTALGDPRANLQAGAAYLDWLMGRFGGRLDLALAAYNAGEGAVARYGNAIPPYAETQAYVRKVMAHYAGLKGGGVSLPSAPVVPVRFRPARASPHASPDTGELGQLLRIFTSGSPRTPESGNL